MKPFLNSHIFSQIGLAIYQISLFIICDEDSLVILKISNNSITFLAKMLLVGTITIYHNHRFHKPFVSTIHPSQSQATDTRINA